MLVELSKYYGVTTDVLLGLTEESQQSTRDMICSSFIGLDRKESVLKAFDTVKSIIPALFYTIGQYDDGVNDGEDVLPCTTSSAHRSHVSTHEFFEFVAYSENVNVAVMMLRNKANFAWMNDPVKQKRSSNSLSFCQAKMCFPYCISFIPQPVPKALRQTMWQEIQESGKRVFVKFLRSSALLVSAVM